MENQGEITRVKRVQLWDAGIDLGISWKKFGALRQREQQIQKMGTPHSLMLQELMLGDVFGMITDGELIALGYRIQPSPSDGPIVIPWDIFTVRPEFDDVSNSVVIASGYKYERIKLVEKSHFESLIAEIPSDFGAQDSPSIASIKPENPVRLKRGGGRKNLYPEAKRVFDLMLIEEPILQNRSAESISPIFNRIYRNMFFKPDETFAEITSRTIFRHWKRYRADLGNDIGKN